MATTHFLESHGELSSAGLKTQQARWALTSWKDKDGCHEQIWHTADCGSHLHSEEPGTVIVSRLKHSGAWQPLTNWTAEHSCQDSQWKVWVRAGAHHLGVRQYEALWVAHHALRLLILAQMNGNCLRHSRTMSFLRLTSSPVLERTLQSLLRYLLIHPFNSHTHRFKALLTLNPILTLCTAISINVTTSSFNAAAVVSMRWWQSISCLCISVKEYRHIRRIFDSELTL